jgi:hypothetical protein
MSIFLRLKLLLFASLILLFSCGDGFNEGSNYGDLLNSPEGLVITPDEHKGGWGRQDCFTCHPIHNIHLNDNSNIGLDMNEVRARTVLEGEAGCADCHGTNGLF